MPISNSPVWISRFEDAFLQVYPFFTPCIHSYPLHMNVSILFCRKKTKTSGWISRHQYLTDNPFYSKDHSYCTLGISILTSIKLACRNALSSKTRKNIWFLYANYLDRLTLGATILHFLYTSCMNITRLFLYAAEKPASDYFYLTATNGRTPSWCKLPRGAIYI